MWHLQICCHYLHPSLLVINFSGHLYLSPLAITAVHCQPSFSGIIKIYLKQLCFPELLQLQKLISWLNWTDLYKPCQICGTEIRWWTDTNSDKSVGVAWKNFPYGFSESHQTFRRGAAPRECLMTQGKSRAGVRKVDSADSGAIGKNAFRRTN